MKAAPPRPRKAALEAATAAATDAASRTRDSRVRSAIEIRVGTTTKREYYVSVGNTRLDSEARFSGVRVLEQEVRGEAPNVRARVHLRLERAQVFVGERLAASRRMPRERWTAELRAFVDWARSRGDRDAQALGLTQLLAVADPAPELASVLELIDPLTTRTCRRCFDPQSPAACSTSGPSGTRMGGGGCSARSREAARSGRRRAPSSARASCSRSCASVAGRCGAPTSRPSITSESTKGTNPTYRVHSLKLNGGH